MISVPTYYLFLGNPGSGKSTLANAVIGEKAFKSGLSFGAGMKNMLQIKMLDSGDIVGDGPGLDDSEKRDEAAKEITQMLKSGKGNYKLIFVCTLDSGRVRGVDIATMKLILDAIAPKVDEVMFGIIINKVSAKVMSILTDARSSDKFKKIEASFNIGKYKTPFIFPYQHIPELEDTEDVLHSPTPALKNFLELVPAVRLEPIMVQEIKANEFEAIQAKLNSEINKICKDKVALEQAMKEQEQTFARQLKSMEKAHEKDIAEITERNERMIAEGLNHLDEEHARMIEDMRSSHEQQMNALRAAKKGNSSMEIMRTLLAVAGLAPLFGGEESPCLMMLEEDGNVPF